MDMKGCIKHHDQKIGVVGRFRDTLALFSSVVLVAELDRIILILHPDALS